MTASESSPIISSVSSASATVSSTPSEGRRLDLRSLVGRALSSNGLWALGDQGIVSVGNFVTGLLVARNLSVSEYGAYVPLLETMLFLNALQSALIAYPLTVRGTVSGRGELRRYVTVALFLTLALLPILGAAMACGVIFGSSSVGDAGLAVSTVGAMVLWQLQETVRRGLMAEFRARASVIGDGISYLGQSLLIYFLAVHGRLTLPSAFAAIGVTSALAAAVQAMQVGMARVVWADVRQMTREFWVLGRWAALSSSTTAVTTLGMIWVLRIAHGRTATADYAAINIPLKLANPIMLGIGNVMLPAVARAAKRVTHLAALWAGVRYALLGACLIVPYYGLIFLFPNDSLRIALGQHSPYLGLGSLLRIYLINTFVLYLQFVVLGLLGGLGRSRESFWAQTVQVVATILVTFPATVRYGLSGLVVAQLATLIVGLGAEMFFLRRVLKSQGGAVRLGVDG